MSKLIYIADTKACKKCYYGKVMVSNGEKSNNTCRKCCHYLLVNDKSRIFEKGKMAYDPNYCDKFITEEEYKANQKEEREKKHRDYILSYRALHRKRAKDYE